MKKRDKKKDSLNVEEQERHFRLYLHGEIARHLD